MLENTSNEPPKFRTRNWVKISDESQGTHNASDQIKYTTSMIRSNLCDYSDAYINVKGTTKISNTRTAVALNNRNKNVIFKNVLHLLIG